MTRGREGARVGTWLSCSSSPPALLRLLQEAQAQGQKPPVLLFLSGAGSETQQFSPGESEAARKPLLWFALTIAQLQSPCLGCQLLCSFSCS